MDEDEKAERIVRDMCDAVCATFGRPNANGLRPFFTDDVVYHNIPLDPAVGIDAAIALLEGFLGMFNSFAIDTRHLAVRDNVVLTERVDTLTAGDTVVALPVMGAFEVRDGKISAWRDYFDMAEITKALSGNN